MATDAVIAEIGLILEAQGSPRIAGLIFGLLIVEGKPMSLGDMTARLAISRGSASTNARLLATQGLIRPSAQLGGRQDFYEIVPDPFCRVLETLSNSMLSAAEALTAAAARLPRERGDARARVDDLAESYRVSSRFVADWWKAMAARETSNS